MIVSSAANNNMVLLFNDLHSPQLLILNVSNAIYICYICIVEEYAKRLGLGRRVKASIGTFHVMGIDIRNFFHKSN